MLKPFFLFLVWDLVDLESSQGKRASNQVERMSLESGKDVTVWFQLVLHSVSVHARRDLQSFSSQEHLPVDSWGHLPRSANNSCYFIRGATPVGARRDGWSWKEGRLSFSVARE